jgi:hypothetical protein
MPPTKIADGRSYSWLEGELSKSLPELPKWIVDLFLSRNQRKSQPKKQSHLDGDQGYSLTAENIEITKEALRYLIPDDRDMWFIGLCALTWLAGATGEIDKCREIYEWWCDLAPDANKEHNDDQWHDMLDSDYEGPNGPIRMRTIFFMAREKGWSERVPVGQEVAETLATYDIKYTKVNVKGKLRIIEKMPGGGFNYSTEADFKQLTQHLHTFNSKGTPIYHSNLWLLDRKIKIFDGVEFKPIGFKIVGDKLYRTRDGKIITNNSSVTTQEATKFNCWTGFSRIPSMVANLNKCSFFKRLVREAACSNDESKYKYLMGYLAHLIQRPDEIPGVAIVFPGGKGEGKSFLCERIMDLVSRHRCKVSSTDQIYGPHNDHMAGAIVVVAEEAFWAGSKKDVGKLQDLITSPTILINPKGTPAYEMESHVRLFIPSNEAWIVPAGHDERRYFVC